VFVDQFEQRYKVHDVLGRGAFAVVYLASRRHRPESHFAIKVYTRANAARFRLESFILSGVASSLRHPNIVRYIEFVVDESRSSRSVALLPVMEALHGPDLFDWLARRQQSESRGECSWISESEVANVMRQTLSGLSYLHGRCPYVVHRDIKAENLRWDSNNAEASLKLVDFGLCYVDGYDNFLAGQAVGTPIYSSPEMLQGCIEGKPRPTLDMYSVGVVLFVLLSSQFPYTETADRAIPPVMHVSTWGRISRNVVSLTRKLLSTDPSTRPSADEALKNPWFQDSLSARRRIGPGTCALPSPCHSVMSLRERSSLSSIVFRNF